MTGVVNLDTISGESQHAPSNFESYDALVLELPRRDNLDETVETV